MVLCAVLFLAACSTHMGVKGRPESRQVTRVVEHIVLPLPLPPPLPVADKDYSLEARFVFDSQEYVVYLLEDLVPPTEHKKFISLSQGARNAILRASLTQDATDRAEAVSKLGSFEKALVAIGQTPPH